MCEDVNSKQETLICGARDMTHTMF